MPTLNRSNRCHSISEWGASKYGLKVFVVKDSGFILFADERTSAKRELLRWRRIRFADDKPTLHSWHNGSMFFLWLVFTSFSIMVYIHGLHKGVKSPWWCPSPSAHYHFPLEGQILKHRIRASSDWAIVNPFNWKLRFAHDSILALRAKVEPKSCRGKTGLETV